MRASNRFRVGREASNRSPCLALLPFPLPIKHASGPACLFRWWACRCREIELSPHTYVAFDDWTMMGMMARRGLTAAPSETDRNEPTAAIQGSQTGMKRVLGSISACRGLDWPLCVDRSRGQAVRMARPKRRSSTPPSVTTAVSEQDASSERASPPLRQPCCTLCVSCRPPPRAARAAKPNVD